MDYIQACEIDDDIAVRVRIGQMESVRFAAIDVKSDVV